ISVALSSHGGVRGRGCRLRRCAGAPPPVGPVARRGVSVDPVAPSRRRARQCPHALRQPGGRGGCAGPGSGDLAEICPSQAGGTATVTGTGYEPMEVPARRSAGRRVSEAPTLWFDVGDFLEFFRYLERPTGIQRVEMEIFAQL